MDLHDAPRTPGQIRELIRKGQFSGVTSGMAPGHVQTNLVILTSNNAFDFLLFCQRNPKSCPLLEVVEPGSSEPTRMAAGADLRTDLPTVGLDTLRDCKTAGIKGIVLKSKKNIFLEINKCIFFANKYKMFITVK